MTDVELIRKYLCVENRDNKEKFPQLQRLHLQVDLSEAGISRLCLCSGLRCAGEAEVEDWHLETSVFSEVNILAFSGTRDENPAQLRVLAEFHSSREVGQGDQCWRKLTNFLGEASPS